MISRRLFLSALAALPLVKWARGRQRVIEFYEPSTGTHDLVYPNGSRIRVTEPEPCERMIGGNYTMHSAEYLAEHTVVWRYTVPDAGYPLPADLKVYRAGRGERE